MLFFLSDVLEMPVTALNEVHESMKLLLMNPSTVTKFSYMYLDHIKKTTLEKFIC